MLAALVYALLVPYAQPGDKTEVLVREALAGDKPVYTLDSPANAHLLVLGVWRWDMAQPQKVKDIHVYPPETRKR